jgi:hypothetical protein
MWSKPWRVPPGLTPKALAAQIIIAPQACDGATARVAGGPIGPEGDGRRSVRAVAILGGGATDHDKRV